MAQITETEVVQACQTLFGSNVNISRDFLYYMQPSGVKSAYRRKAMENHPDFFASDPLHIQQKQTALFRDILRAYDVLNRFFQQREEGSWTTPNRAPRPQRRNGGSRPAQSRPRQSSSTRRSDDTYYRGAVPRRTLQVGQFLYYRGKISFGELINALVWQRKQRPTFGDIAFRWGWIDREGLNRIYKLTDRPRLFGEKAVELGLLTVFQVNTILMYQRSQQHRLGDYFLQNDILIADDLERLVRELEEHNAAVLSGTFRPERN